MIDKVITSPNHITTMRNWNHFFIFSSLWSNKHFSPISLFLIKRHSQTTTINNQYNCYSQIRWNIQNRVQIHLCFTISLQYITFLHLFVVLQSINDPPLSYPIIPNTIAFISLPNGLQRIEDNHEHFILQNIEANESQVDHSLLQYNSVLSKRMDDLIHLISLSFPSLMCMKFEWHFNIINQIIPSIEQFYFQRTTLPHLSTLLHDFSSLLPFQFVQSSSSKCVAIIRTCQFIWSIE